MIPILGWLVAILLALCVVWHGKVRRFRALAERAQDDLLRSRRELSEVRAEREADLERARHAAETGLAEARELVEREKLVVRQLVDQARAHYEEEVRKVREEADALVATKDAHLERLRGLEAVGRDEQEARATICKALDDARAMCLEAQAVLDAAKAAAQGVHEAAAQERREINAEIREIRTDAKEAAEQRLAEAKAALEEATLHAHEIVEAATRKAEVAGGRAFRALAEHEELEQALTAMRNAVEGYGDKYIVPSQSLLDDLAADFGHTEAGRALAAARAHSKRMVETGVAAVCDAEKAEDRKVAIQFLLGYFNGEVDAILAEVRDENYGTLAEKVRNMFALANMNGKILRVRVADLYLDSRLEELKWAGVVEELKLKERQEQRALRERIREEERSRREYERAMEDAQREEARIKKAMVEAQAQAQALRASAEGRAELEAQIALLNEQLKAAEEKNARALSMAQQTKAGHVYIISNVGAFGDDVFKIGLTRRLEPLERIRELGDASVPFEFDVHALIHSEDAPALEALLHQEFDDLRLNKVNFRKEFFRVPLHRIREVVSQRGLQASFSMLAEAREFRESQVIEKMTPQERQRWYERHAGGELHA